MQLPEVQQSQFQALRGIYLNNHKSIDVIERSEILKS